MLGPAGILEKIESNIDYSLEDGSPIFSLHCTKTNECNVEILTIGDSNIIFPPYSFIQGAVYHIYLKMAIFDEQKAGFIGYRLIKEHK